MKILHVSDVHGSLGSAEKIRDRSAELEADLVVISGDLTHFGDVEDAEMILDKISEAGRPIFFVPGNCDPRALLRWTPENQNIRNLHLNVVEFRGHVFAGVGGAVGSYGTLLEFSEEEVEEALRGLSLPRGGFTLVSHSPPYGLEVDYTGVKHIGSKAIRSFVELREPRLVLCGHAHEGRGVAKLGGTVIVNSGPAKNGYCSVVEIGEDGGVEVTLSTLY